MHLSVCLCFSSSVRFFFSQTICHGVEVEKHHTHPHTLQYVCAFVFVLIIRDPSLWMIAHLINWHLNKWGLIADPSISCHLLFISLSRSVLELMWDEALHTHARCLQCFGFVFVSHVRLWEFAEFWRCCRRCCLCFSCEMLKAAPRVKASHLLMSLSVSVCSLPVSRSSMWIRS